MPATWRRSAQAPRGCSLALRHKRRAGDHDVAAVRRASLTSRITLTAFRGTWRSSSERIYGGIHYRFDKEAGDQVGRAVADFVFANYMTRR